MNPIEYGAPISLAAAKRVIAAAEAESQANGWQMVIVVLDSGGHLLTPFGTWNTDYARGVDGGMAHQ